ncbi:MAG TPA: protein-disulfide reductase DsbD domain-containing protein [Phycisphaerae bacterium]|nr:protein-disulfide reductase DsbD domain-containing protein [Phycisphaerae bacterium]
MFVRDVIRYPRKGGRRLLRLALAGIAATAVLGSSMAVQARGQPPFGGLSPTLGPAPADEPVKAKLLADTTAVVPGRPFRLAVSVGLAESWHIYWSNPGGPGLPTQIVLRLPDGFTSGVVQYPVPTRFTTPPDIESFGYEQGATFLVEVTPPNTIDLPAVQIEADVTWLACKDVCIRGNQKLSLRLPVAGETVTAAPANGELFRRAEQSIPTSVDQAGQIKVSAYLSMNRVRPGDRVFLAVVAEGSSKAALSQDPGAELFPARSEGLSFGTATYEVSAGEGGWRLVARVPVDAHDSLPAGQFQISGVLAFHVAPAGAGEPVRRGLRFELLTRAAEAGAAVSPAHPDVFGTVRPGGPMAAAGATQAETSQQAEGFLGFLRQLGLPGLLIACALYGLAINATPCVLPIVSIKVVSFVQQARDRSGRAAALGISFGVGVVVVFVLLGFLAASGKNLLQFPPAVIGVGAVVMVLALSMLGVYTLRAPTVASELDARLGNETVAGSFGKGMLAPVLGFACTAPLLAGALAWATRQPPATAMLAFVAAGVGMAMPYVLLSLFPGWLRLLPKPGAWMITFERIMGFVLLGAVLWLLHPLVTQIGPAGLEWTLAFLIAVAAACWVLGKASFSGSAASRWGYRAGAVAIVVLAGLLIYGWFYPLDEAAAEQRRLAQAEPGQVDWDRTIPWQRWSPEKVAEVVSSGRPAFVEFTAAYCTVCKANLKLYIDTPEVRAKMRELSVVPLRGDYTSEDPQIAEVLRRYGRIGVPLYLVYIAGKPDKPTVLPTTLSKAMLIDALTQAAAKLGGSGQDG